MRIYRSVGAIMLGCLFALPVWADYQECDINTTCNFVMHAGTGRHVKLNNIAKSKLYHCEINTISGVGEFSSSSGLQYDFARASAEVYTLDIDATHLIADFADLKFNIINYSDMANDASISCELK